MRGKNWIGKTRSRSLSLTESRVTRRGTSNLITPIPAKSLNQFSFQHEIMNISPAQSYVVEKAIALWRSRQAKI
ncbi:MAG: hypothetical protein RLP02_08955 [Coleofasciculus sp. C2-GNP5-27]